MYHWISGLNSCKLFLVYSLKLIVAALIIKNNNLKK